MASSGSKQKVLCSSTTAAQLGSAALPRRAAPQQTSATDNKERQNNKRPQTHRGPPTSPTWARAGRKAGGVRRTQQHKQQPPAASVRNGWRSSPQAWRGGKWGWGSMTGSVALRGTSPAIGSRVSRSSYACAVERCRPCAATLPTIGVGALGISSTRTKRRACTTPSGLRVLGLHGPPGPPRPEF